MVDEVSKVKTISDAMQEIDELAKSLSSKSDDNLLICAALLAVTRQHYIEALGVEQTSFIFQSVVESFDYYNGYGENLDVPVTIHQEVTMKLLQDLWTHLKEWSDWGMKDWIKAGIVAIIVIIVLQSIMGA